MMHSRSSKGQKLTLHQILQAWADDLRQDRGNGHHLLLARSFEARKSSHWPHLELGYGRPRLNLDVPEFRSLYEHLKTLAVGHDESTILPLIAIDEVENVECLVSGWEMYERTVKRKEYYLLNAENKIIDDNIEDYKCIKDANLFEVCIGNGEKLARILEQLQRQEVRPKCIYINDIDDELLEVARARLAQYGPIVTVPGDVSGEELWHHHLFKGLKKDPAASVFMMHATMNNLKSQKKLLKHINQAFKPETKFFVGVDCTIDRDTIAAAYNCVETAQWMVGEFVYWSWESDIKVKTMYITASAEPREVGETISVKLSINNAQTQKFLISYDNHEQLLTLSADQTIYCGENSKISENSVANLFAEAGWNVTKRLRRAESVGKTNVIIWHGYTQTLARRIEEDMHHPWKQGHRKRRSKNVMPPRIRVSASAPTC